MTVLPPYSLGRRKLWGSDLLPRRADCHLAWSVKFLCFFHSRIVDTRLIFNVDFYDLLMSCEFNNFILNFE